MQKYVAMVMQTPGSCVVLASLRHEPDGYTKGASTCEGKGGGGRVLNRLGIFYQPGMCFVRAWLSLA